MSDINQITGFTVISTNADRNVLHDVTRDDLVDILNRMFVESKCDKITAIVEDILSHMKFDGDPHEFTMEQLKESVLEKVYAHWLSYGYAGDFDYFKDFIFKYYKSCTFFSLIMGRRVDVMTSVRNVFNAILDHNVTINDYDHISVFSFSERERQWDGYYSGVKFKTDGTLAFSPDSEPSVIHHSNGAPWYKWDVEIPKKLGDSIITFSVDTDNTNYLIYYKLSTDDTWTPYTNKIVVPNMLPDNTDSTFDIVKEELLTYQFKIEYLDTPFVLTDIITTIDTSNVITDDPALQELYKDIPHTNAWNKFFDFGTPSRSTFGWYAYINPKYVQDTDTSWIRRQCTFELAVQAHQNLLISSDKIYPSTLYISNFVLSNDIYKLEFYTKIIGAFSESIPTITNMAILSNVYIGVKLIKNNETIDEISTPDLGPCNRALYRYMCSCDFDTNTFKIWYHDETGLVSVGKTSKEYFDLKIPTEWKVPNPANFVTNTYIGLHELVCYDEIVTDKRFIEVLTMTDISDRPYVPIGYVSKLDDNYFGFNEYDAADPFDVSPFYNGQIQKTIIDKTYFGFSEHAESDTFDHSPFHK